MVIGRPQSKTLEDSMRTIKLLFICISVIYAAKTSAQVVLVPEQKVAWLDIEQNRTNFSIVADLCPSLIVSADDELPHLAFRASSPKDQKYIQPLLSEITTGEIRSSFFDNEQLASIEDEFKIEITSVQIEKDHQQVISIVPFRRRNGKIERLLSFEVTASTSFNETKKNNYS